jgi:hypothetical protein
MCLTCPKFATALTYCNHVVGSISTLRHKRENQVLQRFQAEIMHSPPVTMLHTSTCPVCGEHGDLVRLIRARNVSEAVLELIATYMSEGVRRNVTVCQCTKERITPTRGGLFARRA